MVLPILLHMSLFDRRGSARASCSMVSSLCSVCLVFLQAEITSVFVDSRVLLLSSLGLEVGELGSVP